MHQIFLILLQGLYRGKNKHKAEVSWGGEGKPMLLGGNYSFVFTGTIEM